MRTILEGPSRAYATARMVRTLIGQILEPAPEKVLRLESVMTSLARPEDIERYLGALRACPATAQMMDERYLAEPYDLCDLEGYEAGTLGRVYHDHMIENDLRPDYFEAIDPSDDFAFSRLRMYQTHDLWHVATGYPTSVIGELAIVGFYLGQYDRYMGDRAAPAATFSAILSGSLLLHAAMLRQDRITHFYRALVDGWQRGRDAEPLFAVRWEEQWTRPISTLRAELGISESPLMRIAPTALAA